jgi:ABC-2 type transport system ATP-binding protein
VFFSSHILSDVESMCDHVTILRKGSVVVSGRLSELLKSQVKRTNLVLAGASEEFAKNAVEQGHQVSRHGERLAIEVEGDERVDALVKAALAEGFRLLELVPRHETLEDLFVREAIDEVKRSA